MNSRTDQLIERIACGTVTQPQSDHQHCAEQSGRARVDRAGHEQRDQDRDRADRERGLLPVVDLLGDAFDHVEVTARADAGHG